VKRLLALVAGMLGLRALMRRSRPAPTASSHADELRAKLAEVKEPERETQPPTIDERRADVHARGRQAMEDLKTELGEE
jgi:hypothetical protein